MSLEKDGITILDVLIIKARAESMSLSSFVSHLQDAIPHVKTMKKGRNIINEKALSFHNINNPAYHALTWNIEGDHMDKCTHFIKTIGNTDVIEKLEVSQDITTTELINGTNDTDKIVLEIPNNEVMSNILPALIPFTGIGLGVDIVTKSEKSSGSTTYGNNNNENIASNENIQVEIEVPTKVEKTFLDTIIETTKDIVANLPTIIEWGKKIFSFFKKK